MVKQGDVMSKQKFDAVVLANSFKDTVSLAKDTTDQPLVICKRPAKAVLTGETGYSAGRATRQGSSSLTRFTGQSAITFSTCRR